MRTHSASAVGNIAERLDQVERKGIGIDVASVISHNAIRVRVMRLWVMRLRFMDEGRLRKANSELDACLSADSIGMLHRAATSCEALA